MTPQGRLLGQRRRRESLRDAPRRTRGRRAVHDAMHRRAFDRPVHRGLLQRRAAALASRLRQSDRVRIEDTNESFCGIVRLSVRAGEDQSASATSSRSANVICAPSCARSLSTTTASATSRARATSSPPPPATRLRPSAPSADAKGPVPCFHSTSGTPPESGAIENWDTTGGARRQACSDRTDTTGETGRLHDTPAMGRVRQALMKASR